MKKLIIPCLFIVIGFIASSFIVIGCNDNRSESVQRVRVEEKETINIDTSEMRYSELMSHYEKLENMYNGSNMYRTKIMAIAQQIEIINILEQRNHFLLIATQ